MDGDALLLEKVPQGRHVIQTAGVQAEARIQAFGRRLVAVRGMFRAKQGHGAPVAVIFCRFQEGQGHIGHIFLLGGQGQHADDLEWQAHGLHLAVAGAFEPAGQLVARPQAQAFGHGRGKHDTAGSGPRTQAARVVGIVLAVQQQGRYRQGMAGQQGILMAGGLHGDVQGRAPLRQQLHRGGQGAGSGHDEGHPAIVAPPVHIGGGKVSAAHGGDLQRGGIVAQAFGQGLHHAELDAEKDQQRRQDGRQPQDGAGGEQTLVQVIPQGKVADLYKGMHGVTVGDGR